MGSGARGRCRGSGCGHDPKGGDWRRGPRGAPEEESGARGRRAERERGSGCGRDGEAKRGRREVQVPQDAGPEGRMRPARDSSSFPPQVKEITFLKNMVMECDACGELGGAAGRELRGFGAHGERPGKNRRDGVLRGGAQTNHTHKGAWSYKPRPIRAWRSQTPPWAGDRSRTTPRTWAWLNTYTPTWAWPSLTPPKRGVNIMNSLGRGVSLPGPTHEWAWSPSESWNGRAPRWPRPIGAWSCLAPPRTGHGVCWAASGRGF